MVTKEAIKKIPDKPGVYLMKDSGGRVIYVGKALSLKKRVASYFLKNQPSVKTKVMLSNVRTIDFRTTASEYDALILEARLIKRFKPRFNISLRDDKSFPYIKITRETAPRVFIGRKKKDDVHIDCIGPYTSAKLLRSALTILRKSFPFRSCRRFPKRVCLNYDLALCPGPCQQKISKKKYLEILESLENFLLKEESDLIQELSLKMRQKANAEQFEEAAQIRDQLEALSLLISLGTGRLPKNFPGSEFQRLGLNEEPARIEAFDISNISAQQAVGSMVSFYKGKPDKSNYRRFKIKTVFKIDDYAMIREVVRRRVERLIKENKKMPDMMVIDGGLGHLEAAQGVLKSLKVEIPVIAIAKNQELIYIAYRKEPLRLDRHCAALRLVQRVRDEAHRFALAYHRLLRNKEAFEKS